MLTIPIFYPIITDLGYDPVWFGIIIVLVTQMGVITPPVGINVYVVSGIAQDIPLEKIFTGVLPFLAALIVGTALLVAFPRSCFGCPTSCTEPASRPARGTMIGGHRGPCQPLLEPPAGDHGAPAAARAPA